MGSGIRPQSLPSVPRTDMETYEKKKRIGKGTFGEAWLVRSKYSGRRYVIKEIRLGDMPKEDIEKSYMEASILRRCKHNNIIRYKEVFILPHPKTLCIVMEYADGGDLSGIIKAACVNGETFEEKRILYWFIQLTFAVQYLHNNDILHRDLKTQNIFLTTSNLIKLGDFGIARFLRNKEDLATTAIGTPYYLSPEICRRSWSALVHDLISVLLRTTAERRPSADQLLLIPALKPLVEKYLKVHQSLIDFAEKNSNNHRRHHTIHCECRELEDKACIEKSLVPLEIRYIKQDLPNLPACLVRDRCNSDSIFERPQASFRSPQPRLAHLVSPSSCRRRIWSTEDTLSSSNDEHVSQDQCVTVRTPSRASPATVCSPSLESSVFSSPDALRPN
ncbi:serine/threonine-protein kinase Nek5-like isoform X3 [Oratosquilla oratoria]|uniref:serine/threonine-protein kinase Nek5-like isoform X3 n=1 Tax=Oratosquilla oratoria TaxID=337810 RepID=UPI003F75B6DD